MFCAPSGLAAVEAQPSFVPSSQVAAGNSAPEAHITQDTVLLRYFARAEAAADKEVARNNWRYFWSALAQSLAAIATLVFTVTLVMSQLRARFGMEAAKAVLTLDNTLRFLLLLAAMAISLLGIHWRLFHNPIPAILVVAGSLAVLLWHASYMPRSLSMNTTAAHLGRGVRAGAWPKHGTRGMLRQLETIAHAALAQADFDVLHTAAAELAMTVAHAERRSRTTTEEESSLAEEEHREALSFLRKLLLQSAGSPKAASIVADAFVEGAKKYDPECLPRLVCDIIDTFDFALRTCAWPRQEESYVSIFEVVGSLLEALARLRDVPSETFGDLIDQCTVFLPNTKNGRANAPGSGHAGYELLLACLRAATTSGGQRDAVDACIQKSLALVDASTACLQLQRFSGWAVLRVTSAVRQMWSMLDERSTALRLERLELRGAIDRETLRPTYRELLGLALREEKYYMAAACLCVSNTLSTEPQPVPSELALTLAIAASEANAALLASDSAASTPVNGKLGTLLRDTQKYWVQGDPKTLEVMLHLLALARPYAGRMPKKADSIVPVLWDTAKSLQGRVVSYEGSSDDDKQEATYVAVTTGWLARLHYGQLDHFKYESIKDDLRHTVRSFARFDPNKATVRARVDFTPYADELQRYYLGNI